MTMEYIGIDPDTYREAKNEYSTNNHRSIINSIGNIHGESGPAGCRSGERAGNLYSSGSSAGYIQGRGAQHGIYGGPVTSIPQPKTLREAFALMAELNARVASQEYPDLYDSDRWAHYRIAGCSMDDHGCLYFALLSDECQVGQQGMSLETCDYRLDFGPDYPDLVDDLTKKNETAYRTLSYRPRCA